MQLDVITNLLGSVGFLALAQATQSAPADGGNSIIIAAGIMGGIIGGMKLVERYLPPTKSTREDSSRGNPQSDECGRQHTEVLAGQAKLADAISDLTRNVDRLVDAQQYARETNAQHHAQVMSALEQYRRHE